MNIGLNDVYFFIKNRQFKNGLTIGISRKCIIKMLGFPLNYMEQRKKNNEIIGYGAINIYLWNDMVVSFSINSNFNYYNNTTIEIIKKDEIIRYLESNIIKIDNYFLFDDIDYICFGNVKMGFYQNKLSYLAQGM